MTKVPRASLSITILNDEDYCALMASKGGAEAFGVFTAIVVAARQRLQDGKVQQLSESDSLRFDNSTAHICAMAHVTTKQLDKCLSLLAAVAEETGGEPWLYLDETSHLVVRSFFKFNTSAGWGGPRPGAGRPPKGGHEGEDGNQLDSNLNPSRIPSGTATSTFSGTDSFSGTSTATGDDADDAPTDWDRSIGIQTCVELAMELFGDAAANAVHAARRDIRDKLNGRYDCYHAALKAADRKRKTRGAEPILNLHAFCITVAMEYAVTGLPADPVEVKPAGADPSEKQRVLDEMTAKLKARRAADAQH